MSKIVKFGNYVIPALCLFNIFAVQGEAKLGWAVAFAGWTAHLLEVRKHDH
jgi:hypothetical protein